MVVMSLDKKLRKLEERLRELGSAVVAYSGGVDSAFLLKIASKILKKEILAVTAVSETYPKSELDGAKKLAKKIKVRHLVIQTNELQNPLFRRNPPNRCYYCKQELFAQLKNLAIKEGLNFVIDGSNVDDLLDYRPGARAKKELGVISPLQEVGFTKAEIRKVSRKLKISIWKKPALACLASRVPYDSEITKDRLARIDRAEGFLRDRFNVKGNLRVRDFGKTARIEVDKKEIKKLKDGERIKILLKPLGYTRVKVDEQGYRLGALNKDVTKK